MTNLIRFRIGITFFLLCGLWSQITWSQTSLDQNWKFCPVQSYQPEINQQELSCHPIKIPAEWETVVAGYDGYGLLFSDFDLDESQVLTHLGLYIARVRDSDKTYLNGQLIGSTGEFPPEFDKGVLFSRLYPIPDDLLKTQSNEIKIWIYNDGRKGGLPVAAPIIDNYVKLVNEQNARNNIQNLLIVTLIVFAVFNLFHYVFNRKDIENLFFSGFLLAWSLYLYLLLESTVSSGWSLSFIFRTNVAAFFVVFALYLPFIFLFFKKPIPMGIKLIVTITLIMIPISYWLPYDHWVYIPLQVVEVLLIPALIYLFILLRTAIKEKLPYAWLMTTANLTYAFLGGHDIVADFLGKRVDNNDMLFGPWALLFLAFSLTLILSHKHMKYYIFASVDQLTQALRYPYFLTELQNMLTMANESNLNVLLVMIDLDNFKKINDQYGHALGNQALKEVAFAVRNRLHQTDLFTRYGGDEFCLAMLTDEIEGSQSKIQAIHQDISNLVISNTKQVKISATFGAVYKTSVKTLLTESLVNEADELLIKSKITNKGQVSWGH